jgi:1,2-diacylglycerol 3-beta-galactosyltransferase
MRIDLIYFDAGGGHRAAAEALRDVMARDPRWQPRLVHLQELLDPIDPLRRFFGKRMQDSYNDMLRTGRTLGAAYILPVLHTLVRALHPGGVRLLEKFWWEDPPDIALSLVPNFNRTLKAGLERAAPGTPFVTLLTDLADHPPHFWMEKQEQYFICGTAKAAAQAEAMGHAAAKVFLTSGMVVHPRFYEQPEIDRADERRRLGLDPERPTALVLFGGQGSRAMIDIADRLNDSALDVQAIMICGKNAELLSTLKKRCLQMPVFLTGFTREIPRFLRLSDFFIGKPGPGCVSEALTMGLPVIVESNAWTLPQERYNAQWIAETGTGLVVRDFRQIGEAAARMLQPDQFPRFHGNAAALGNRAVFEVPEILEHIVKLSPRPMRAVSETFI